MVFGISVLNENEMHTETILKQLGTTEDGRRSEEVLQKIKLGKVSIQKAGRWIQVPGLDHGDLMRKVRHKMSARAVAEVIQSLAESEDIMVDYSTGNRKRIYLVMEKK